MCEFERPTPNALKQALGGVIPASLRPRFVEWKKTEGELFIRYQEIPDMRKLDLFLSLEEVEFRDGEEGITLWIHCNK